MTDRFVLDASAILCLIRGEPGADVVKTALPNSVVSTVNLSEVIAKMSDLGMEEGLIEAVLEPLQIRAIPFDETQARIAGLLRPQTRAKGLSLGDRACLGLATHLAATALTTDRAWSDLGGAPAITLAR